MRKARNGSKGYIFFFAFLCVSEHFESIETYFFLNIFVSAKRAIEHLERDAIKRKAQNARQQSEQDASAEHEMRERSE